MIKLIKLEKSLIRSMVIMLSLLITLVVLLGLFLVLKPETAKVNTAKPTIALVNNDTGGTFNNASYAFGKQFVNLVSNDNKYNWVVVPESVAKKAYDDGSINNARKKCDSFSYG